MTNSVNTAGPGGYDAHVDAGGELLRLDRVAEARIEFESALRLKPDDTKALGLLGLTLFRMTAFEDALPVYEQLVSTNPSDPSLRLNLGLVHLKLGNADQAIGELTRSRELDPSQSRAVSYLGLAYARNGDYALAYQAFIQGGQTDLAREMEQYLTPTQRAELARAIAPAPAAPPPRPSDAYEAVEVADEDIEIMEAADLSAAETPPEPTPEPTAAKPALDPDPDFEPDFAFDGDPHIATRPAPEARPADHAEVEGVVIQPHDARGAISRAVDSALPSAAVAASARRAAAGHQPPQPLSEFATARLIRPDDGEHPFEISAGGVLVVRVDGRVLSRTEGVIASGGELAYEPAGRRVRGATTDETFGSDGRPVFFVSGQGHMVAAPLGEHFAAVSLDDDILYLREDLVFAFQEQLRWENGHVPGSDHSINMVQFRGDGAVAIRSRKPLLSVKLAPDKVLYADAEALAGWIGRVVPRLVQPAAGGKTSAAFVECSGEGVLLLDDTFSVTPE
ncbi:MAG TPA: tetratricopeptide repeat protein [Kofleriaceae bacterium]|nr:tetratricopeptide repeat protein [Kofleriaceae bacterium]